MKGFMSIKRDTSDVWLIDELLEAENDYDPHTEMEALKLIL